LLGAASISRVCVCLISHAHKHDIGRIRKNLINKKSLKSSRPKEGMIAFRDKKRLLAKAHET
jgi:hypothetical protein